MASNTENLSLYKIDPATDGDNTFNIEIMLNENWDKIDAAEANYKRRPGYGVASGATDAYSITVEPAITVYATWQMFNVICNTANTGAATLNICGLGAKAIKKVTPAGLADLTTGDIPGGGTISVIYNGAYWVAINLGLGSHAAVNAFNAHTNNPASRVFATAAQSIASSTNTLVTFGAGSFDVGNMFDISDPTKLVAKEAGRYLILGSVDYDINNEGYRQVSILYNGAAIASQRHAAISGVPMKMGVATLCDLAVNNYVQLQVYHTSGSSINIPASGGTRLEAVKVG